MLKPWLVAATLMIGMIGLLQVEGAAKPQFGFLTDLFRPLKVTTGYLVFFPTQIIGKICVSTPR